MRVDKPMETTELISRYLASPDTKSAVVAELSRNADAAFQAIQSYQGPYPNGMHPIDAHEEYLTALLVELIKRFPRLLIGPNPAKMTSQPFILISAAIAADDPRFAETILAGLKHRSIYVKLVALNGIVRLSFLRTPEVKQQLLRLMVMKSIAKDEYSMERIQEALALFPNSL